MRMKRLPEPEEKARARFAKAAMFVSCISCKEEERKPPQGTRLPPEKPPEVRRAPGANKAERPCRDEMARHSTFCMDRFEAHLVYRDTGRPHPHYIRPVDFSLVMAASDAGVFSQGYLSQLESAIVCGNSGKRLCTLSEWREACSAGKNRFAYGNAYRRNICNSGRVPHVMSLYFGGNYKGHYWDNDQFNDPLINSTPGYLARSGIYRDCVSEEGVSDMIGNLHEWVSDVGANGMGTFAGSCYSDNDFPCSYYSQVHARGYHDYSTGTRCCTERGDVK